MQCVNIWGGILYTRLWKAFSVYTAMLCLYKMNLSMYLAQLNKYKTLLMNMAQSAFETVFQHTKISIQDSMRMLHEWK